VDRGSGFADYAYRQCPWILRSSEETDLTVLIIGTEPGYRGRVTLIQL